MPTPTDNLFPHSERVIYEKAPLVQVICQLKFPPLLRIESEPPAAFQERIRGTFPLFERVSNPLANQIPQEIAQLINAQINKVAYRFSTEDNSSVVELAPDQISLTTTRYSIWEKFCEQLRLPLLALNDIYNPSFFTRIGLRYADIILRGKLGLAERPWSVLLRQEILGELAKPEFESNLEEVKRYLKVRIPNGRGSILLQHGLVLVEGSSELGYLFDFDFFNAEKTENESVQPLLNSYNEMAGQAFRWCITEELSAALEPRGMGPFDGNQS